MVGYPRVYPQCCGDKLQEGVSWAGNNHTIASEYTPTDKMEEDVHEEDDWEGDNKKKTQRKRVIASGRVGSHNK